VGGIARMLIGQIEAELDLSDLLTVSLLRPAGRSQHVSRVRFSGVSRSGTKIPKQVQGCSAATCTVIRDMLCDAFGYASRHKQVEAVAARTVAALCNHAAAHCIPAMETCVGNSAKLRFFR
jgi:hypothetical protein